MYKMIIRNIQNYRWNVFVKQSIHENAFKIIIPE